MIVEKFSTNFPRSCLIETSRFKIKHIEPVTNAEGTANSDNISQNARIRTISGHNDDNETLSTAAAQKADKHKKRKNKRKREISPESSSSDSGNSSSLEDSEVQGRQKIGRFCKVHYGAERTSSKPGRNHGKIPTENFRCSRKMEMSWKWLEDIKNAPDVPVPVEDHIKLIEQTVLLLGQASNSILYSRRLQILKTLTKDPKKAKNILKEKADLLQKGDQNLFGKKFRSYINETERSKKRKLEIFSGGNRSAPPPAKNLFRTGPSRQT